MSKQVLIGGFAGLLVVGAAVALLVAGGVASRAPKAIPDSILVIATAQDGDETVARFAFVLEAGSSSARILDPTMPATISGTSAKTAEEALSYTGAAGVAAALASQTGGETLGWVVLSPSAWAPLIDTAGGIEVDVSAPTSVYVDGNLTMLDTGPQRITGAEAVSLSGELLAPSSGSSYKELRGQLAAGVSTAATLAIKRIPSLVSSGAAESSLSPAELSAFSASVR